MNFNMHHLFSTLLRNRVQRIQRLVLSALAVLCSIGLSNTSLAQTALGEIEARPSPVFRCPGLPCAVPNVFNITVAVQYNAPAADLTSIQNMITAMSGVLFDVTDGQAQIGEAFIFNNAFSTAADLRIFPSSSPVWWQANTGNYKVGGSMQVSINNVQAAGAAGESLAHEFVHLVFDCRDEYESRPVGCVDPTSPARCPTAAAVAAGATPCLMDQGGNGISSELCWGLANPADATDFSGGNHEAALITEHSRCRSNRSCWEQVVWSWPNQFTMPAGAPDPAAGGAVVGPTSFVVVNSTVRAVLVLDESGSMSAESPSRIERLKVAANDFVTLAETGTELGIVSFSTDAETASGHQNVPIAALNAAQRTACTTAINALTPNGWTGIGLGLQKARDMIIAAGGVTASTYIVLMTDGINNRPLPDWDAQLDGVLADLLADGIPVLVTCTGGDLGLSSQCSEIATATGGFSVDSANSADLPQAFTDFHEKVSGGEGIDSATGKLLSPTAKQVFVEKGAASATFTLLWQNVNDSAELTVIDPVGNSHSGLLMPQGRYLRLTAPASGDYTMILTNRGNATSNSTYVVRAYTRHQINSLAASTRYPTVRPGQPMYLYAYPRSLGGSITDTNPIRASVLLPNGQTNTLNFYDRGHGWNLDEDDIPADGIFTAIFTNTSLKGPYRFLISAAISNWVSATDGEVTGPPQNSPKFSREVRLSGSVGDANDTARLGVSINEWMANNTHTLTNPVTGNFDDWFELYNPNSVSVNLSGWLLANCLSNCITYTIPQGYTIPPKAYRIVWADALNQTNQNELHVNFRLSNNGETIALLAPDGRVVDHVVFGPQTNDVSQGHSPDGGPYIFSFTTPTPGAPNSVMQPPVLRASARLLTGNQVAISFNTMTGLTYRVEYKNNLNAPSWTQLAPAQIATGNSLTVNDNRAGNRGRFYRVGIVQW